MPTYAAAPSPVVMVFYNPDTLAYEAWDASLDTGAVTIGAVNLSQYTPVSGRLPMDGSGVTQPISAAALPLPAGAALEAGHLATIDASTVKISLTPRSGSVSGLGNNTLLTPAAGKKLRLAYASYNPALAVEAGFRFGAAGPLFLRNSVSAGSVIAKDFGDMRYTEGAVDDSLILNLSIGVATIWNALYQEL